MFALDTDDTIRLPAPMSDSISSGGQPVQHLPWLPGEIMPTNRDDLLRMLIPPATAVLLTLLYFAIFNRWTAIGDPINSLVTMIMGTLGFGFGVFLDVLRVRRSRHPVAAETSAGPVA